MSGKTKPAGPGRVSLVGAGPGDPGLLTVKGLECLRTADYIIYDLLANPALLEEAPAGCEKIYAGKKAGGHSMPQEEITALIVACAQKGGHVVRLKGGDPYVFGRGGEEALALAAAGIPFQVVPGVTAPIGGLCYAGIPITHRGRAASFHVITAHRQEGGLLPREYARLAGLGGTLVFLMGLSQAKEISQGLLAGGLSPDTPAAVIARATTPCQKTLTSTLARLPQALQEQPLPFPAMIVVGEVIGLKKELSFFEKLPLFGKHILTTRAAEKQGTGGELHRLLTAAGAQVTELPLQRLIPIGGAWREPLKRLGEYQYLIFTSAFTVKLFWEALEEEGLDARALAGKCLCAVGRATAAALKEHGLRGDIIPETFTAEALFEELAPRLKASDQVFLPQSAAARPFLAEHLAPLCRLTAAAVYRPEKNPRAAKRLGELTAKTNQSQWGACPAVDAIVFTSSAGVQAFAALSQGAELLKETAVFSIGPVTSGALLRQGVTPVESEASSVESLAEALCQWAVKGVK